MLQQYWLGLSSAFARRLLHGSAGSFQRMRLASHALAEAVPVASASNGQNAQGVNFAMLDTGRDLLLAALEDDPLNGDLARQVLGLDKQAPWLESDTRTALLELAAAFVRPENLRYFQRLARQGEYAKIQSYLDGERDKAPDNAYWLQQVLAVGELAGELEWALEHVRHRWPAPLAHANILRVAVEAHLLAVMRRYDDVLALTQDHASAAAGRLLLAAERRAHSLRMTGDIDAAHAAWRQILSLRPWHVNLLSRWHASVSGHDSPLAAGVQGRTAALLYSWNKADDLDKALRSLAPSAADLCRIIALNNGSTDATGQVIDAWAERLGERMQAIHLPVNVGAPAARNWLMHLPELAEVEYLAYLDDDAVLPADWLGHMSRAVAVCPEASVWGGKIIDHAAPHIVQSADLHLVMTSGNDEEIDAAFRPTRAHAVPFNVSDIHAQVADCGGFDYIRPCISVTGCCHLFRRADLMACGDFSLTLSPSQYDDLEHDLRMASRGRHCAYTGFLPVEHMKRTGKAVLMSPAQFGNGLGNKYKLHAMYPRDEIERLMAFETALLEQDLLRKAAMLDGLAAQ
ncbi:glycosyltransferase [Desulfovibrio mangrovi]|uniref:glycosyltransferase family 2 protein n=1 Tax=Desulfovibrio mangrovi TaxID=2976983 RepID=UPI002244FEDD|nr:glycosyltransferase [Desulfovibrio mangrovi]UZP66931.1 glycosyltransferase [Desulfovibrio mangrovi]